MQVLVGVCGLSVEMSFNLAIIKDHLYVKKRNGGLQYCLFEFNLCQNCCMHQRSEEHC